MEIGTKLEPAVEALLNEEIIFHVLKFLPTRDRQKAKRVCKKWKRIACLKIFTENEAINIQFFHEIPFIMEILSETNRTSLNLKFYSYHFLSDFIDLLKEFGSRIETISFYKCRFFSGIVKMIFDHCINIKEFSVCEHCYFENKFSCLRNAEELRFLQDDNLQRETLTSLNCINNNLSVNKENLLSIISAFPNLKSLKFCLSNSVNFFLSSSIFKVVKTTLCKLETFHVKFVLRYPGSNTYLMHALSNETRSNLSGLTSVDMASPTNEDIRRIIFEYKFWKSLNIYPMAQNTPSFIPSLLATLCPDIENLSFDRKLSAGAKELGDVLTALMNSRVKSLHMNVYKQHLDVNFQRTIKQRLPAIESSLSTISSNITLQKLHLHGKDAPDLTELSGLFFKYFLNIREATLIKDKRVPDGPSNMNVEKVAGTTLLHDASMLKPIVESLEFLKTNEPLTILPAYQFSNLKYLIIGDREPKPTYSYVETSSFPWNIFSMNPIITPSQTNSTPPINNEIFSERFGKIISIISKDSPQLEGIEYHCDISIGVNELASILSCCQNLHHLRYISFIFGQILGDDGDLLDEQRKYCNSCPSTRCIWLESSTSYRVFYFNKITRNYEFDKGGKNTYKFNTRLKNLWQCNY